MPHKNFDDEKLFPPITFELKGKTYTVTATPDSIDEVAELGKRIKEDKENMKTSVAIRTQIALLTGESPEVFKGASFRQLMGVLEYLRKEVFGTDDDDDESEENGDTEGGSAG